MTRKCKGALVIAAEKRRLRREHAKAFRLWKATHKPAHWKAMRDIVTEIISLSPRSIDSRSQNTQGRLQ